MIETSQALLNYLNEDNVRILAFFIQYKLIDIIAWRIFLRHNRSKLDYDWFVDAICFDNTFCTNKYNLICALFAGVNHHSKNVLFGYAFLYDEITESFIWLFETFLEAMENKQPKCIFTDKDKAMSNANEIVFSETCQRLCIWHFAKNATQQFATYYTRPELKQYYNNCFYGCSNAT